MTKCYEHVGILKCDREKGHDGPHRDDWILSVPVEFSVKPRPADPVHPPMPVGHMRACGCPECVAWLEAHEPGGLGSDDA